MDQVFGKKKEPSNVLRKEVPMVGAGTARGKSRELHFLDMAATSYMELF